MNRNTLIERRGRMAQLRLAFTHIASRYGCVMPTPFMHLAFAKRLISDNNLPGPAHDLLEAGWGAFLLGSIAPDARVSSGLDRVQTHFFEYLPKVDPPAVVAMLAQHPDLKRTAIDDNTRAAFVAGYASHLAMDELWCTDMLFPVFFESDWGTRPEKFLALHGVLAVLDRRDRGLLPDAYYTQLSQAAPRGWLPFIDDAALGVWRNTIADQLAPGARSLTLEVLANRMSMPLAEFTAFVDDEADIKRRVWANVPRERLTGVESAMYDAARDAVIGYLDDHA